MSACKLGQLLTVLDDEDAGTVGLWLDTGEDLHGRPVSAAAMARALTAEGHPIGETTTKAHRACRCVCHRERTAP